MLKIACGTMESDNFAAETAQRIFADLADPQAINRSRDGAWKEPLWEALAAAGLPLAWVPEDLGGSGASLKDGFAILSAAGRAGSAIPLAETMLAGWLLSQAGIPSPPGRMTIAPCRPRDRVQLAPGGKLVGRAAAVPFARDAGFIAVLAMQGDDGFVALAGTSSCAIEAGQTLAGDPLDTVVFDRVTPAALSPAPSSLDGTALMLMGAAALSLEMAGALETVLSLCVRYADERVAFEKKISKFQAIQHNLARLASETAAAVAAAVSAADAIAAGSTSDETIFLEAAAAKIRCAEAAEKSAAIAHQLHGAIGFTLEHILHRFTFRALSWRDQFGDESYWALELGKRIAKRGGEELWPLIASR
jgi:acyl-CoA dehydrogenase